LVVPDPYQQAGLRRGTTASLQQCSGQALCGCQRIIFVPSYGDLSEQSVGGCLRISRQK
jgi:hypothetical protein